MTTLLPLRRISRRGSVQKCVILRQSVAAIFLARPASLGGFAVLRTALNSHHLTGRASAGDYATRALPVLSKAPGTSLTSLLRVPLLWSKFPYSTSIH